MLGLHEQFIAALERSQNPVIVLRHDANLDDFTAALSVNTLLGKMNKSTEIISTGGPLPKQLTFIESSASLKLDFSNLRKLIIRIKTEATKVGEVKYQEEPGSLTINITPSAGLWQQADVDIRTDGYKHDLIIVIGARDLNALGPIFTTYHDFFHDTPIINIDHTPDNEHFGQINLVDINSTSCSEVCFELFERMDEASVDEAMATCLLTGMIHKTKSFRAPQVTPKTLRVASQLVAKGAKREEIVSKLYKTQSVAALRLWGRALSRLKVNEELKLVWTIITREDFLHAGAAASDLGGIVDELISTVPHAKVVAILYETIGNVEALVQVERPYDALSLTSGLATSGTREAAHLHLHEEDLVLAERQVVTHLENKLQQLNSVK